MTRKQSVYLLEKLLIISGALFEADYEIRELQKLLKISLQKVKKNVKN